MSARAGFEVLVEEFRSMVEEGGGWAHVLELSHADFIDYLLGWLEEQHRAGDLTAEHRAVSVALVRYWLDRGEAV